jgi:hypothetical protein
MEESVCFRTLFAPCGLTLKRNGPRSLVLSRGNRANHRSLAQQPPGPTMNDRLGCAARPRTKRRNVFFGASAPRIWKRVVALRLSRQPQRDVGESYELFSGFETGCAFGSPNALGRMQAALLGITRHCSHLLVFQAGAQVASSLSHRGLLSLYTGDREECALLTQ